MSALADIYLKEETLETLLDTVRKKGERGVALTIGINDETNQYGQNLSAWVSQSKEQREAKQNRFYVGNGKVFHTNGTIKTAEKQQTNSQPDAGQRFEDNLPF